MDIFWGGGHHKTGLFFEVIVNAFYGQGTEWEYVFGVAKISNILLGMLDIIFGIVFLLRWSIPRPLRNLGHSSFSQYHSRRFL